MALTCMSSLKKKAGTGLGGVEGEDANGLCMPGGGLVGDQRLLSLSWAPALAKSRALPGRA